MKAVQILVGAAGQGEVAAMERILAAEPDLAKEWQPIMEACLYGQAGAVRLLLAHGADPNVVSKSPFKYRPLHRAIEHKVTIPKTEGHLEVVRLLLEAGADADSYAMSLPFRPAAVAALGGETQFLALLLPYLPERDIFTAAVLAEEDRVGSLLKADPSLAGAKDLNGWKPLQYVSASQIHAADPSAGERLARIAARLLDLDGDLGSALSYALMCQKTALADSLFARGGTITDGDSVTHAAESGPSECLALLVKYGVDLDQTGGMEHHGGLTPLGALLEMRRYAGARWLVENGASLALKSGKRGETPLHTAARAGCTPEMIRTLLNHGADPTARDGEGRTPLEVARSHGREKIIAILSREG